MSIPNMVLLSIILTVAHVEIISLGPQMAHREREREAGRETEIRPQSSFDLYAWSLKGYGLCLIYVGWLREA